MNRLLNTTGYRSATRTRAAPVTLHDIAREAGTSVSTVSRVLNVKPGAGEATRTKVFDVVERLQYTVNYAASNLKRRTTNLIGVFEDHSRPSSYYARHIEEGYDACVEQLSTFNVHFEKRHVAVQEADVYELLSEVYEHERAELDGLLLVPFRSGRIIALLNRFVDAGVAVVFADKDVEQVRRMTFVGPDNDLAGRMAAELMFRFLRREGTVIVSNPDSRSVHPYGRPGHLGAGSFVRQMSLYTSGIRVESTHEPRKDNRLYTEVRHRLEEDPKIVGIFAASARDTAAIAPALRDSGREREVQMIGSEVFPESFAMLGAGVIDALIYKNPFRVGFKALDHLFGHVVRGLTPASQYRVMPRVVLASAFTDDSQGYEALLEE